MKNQITLDQYIDKKLLGADEKLRFLRLLSIGIQCAEQLKKLHAEGCCRGFLAAQKILLKDEYSLALVLPGELESEPIFREYEAPLRNYTAEQADDVFSLALILLALHCDKALWENGTEVPEHFDEYAAQALTPIPAGMKRLLKRCLSVDPDTRLTADSVYDQLCAFWQARTGEEWSVNAVALIDDTFCKSDYAADLEATFTESADFYEEENSAYEIIENEDPGTTMYEQEQEQKGLDSEVVNFKVLSDAGLN